MINELTSTASFNENIYATPLVLVDFYANWCEPCKWLEKILQELDTKLPDEVSILMINIEAHQELSNENEVKSVPTICLFKNGKEVWRMNGFLDLEDLRAKIQFYL